MSDVQISARIPVELERELQQRARLEDRSFSAEVRRAIRLYLKRPVEEPSCTCPTGFGQVCREDCPVHGTRTPAHTISGPV